MTEPSRKNELHVYFKVVKVRRRSIFDSCRCIRAVFVANSFSYHKIYIVYNLQQFATVLVCCYLISDQSDRVDL